MNSSQPAYAACTCNPGTMINENLPPGTMEFRVSCTLANIYYDIIYIYIFGQISKTQNTSFSQRWRMFFTTVAVFHNSEVAWTTRHVESTANRQLVQHFVQPDKRGNVKALHYWPFLRGIPRSPPKRSSNGKTDYMLHVCSLFGVSSLLSE